MLFIYWYICHEGAKCLHVSGCPSTSACPRVPVPECPSPSARLRVPVPECPSHHILSEQQQTKTASISTYFFSKASIMNFCLKANCKWFLSNSFIRIYTTQHSKCFYIYIYRVSQMTATKSVEIFTLFFSKFIVLLQNTLKKFQYLIQCLSQCLNKFCKCWINFEGIFVSICVEHS